MIQEGWSIPFRRQAAQAIRDTQLRHAMSTSTDTFTRKRAEGVAGVPFEEWRDRASEIRLEVLDNLFDYLDRFAAQATKAGAIIHRAKDGATACDMVGSILKDRGVHHIVKAKSMVTEEIHLNHHLEGLGMEVVETDLGEYIIQLAGETPSHILAPALHKDRSQVGKLFREKLGVDYSEDPAVLTKIARKALRDKFIAAEAGISGANFAIAETGSIVLFTNEGNGRMVTTLPPLHVVVFSLEKLIPKLADLSVFIRLLPRSATGQTLSSYMSLITGTRKRGDATGAEEMHIVVVDNGRSEILTSETREILKCIRCSACMNVCPVYRTIGGHAYGSTYPGPMGIVLTNALEGLEKAHTLLDGTTLCGACDQVCPVKVPLTTLIRRLREMRVERGLTPGGERRAMAAFGLAAGWPSLFSFGQEVSRYFWPVLKTIVGAGAVDRLPKPTKTTFRRRMS